MIIYVRATKTGFTWGKTPSNHTPLEEPIVVTNYGALIVEVVSVGPTGIFYRLQNGASGRLKPNDGPTQEVPENGERWFSFSTSSSGDYDQGVLKVLSSKK